MYTCSSGSYGVTLYSNNDCTGTVASTFSKSSGCVTAYGSSVEIDFICQSGVQMQFISFGLLLILSITTFMSF